MGVNICVLNGLIFVIGNCVFIIFHHIRFSSTAFVNFLFAKRLLCAWLNLNIWRKLKSRSDKIKPTRNHNLKSTLTEPAFKMKLTETKVLIRKCIARRLQPRNDPRSSDTTHTTSQITEYGEIIVINFFSWDVKYSLEESKCHQ